MRECWNIKHCSRGGAHQYALVCMRLYKNITQWYTTDYNGYWSVLGLSFKGAASSDEWLRQFEHLQAKHIFVEPFQNTIYLVRSTCRTQSCLTNNFRTKVVILHASDAKRHIWGSDVPDNTIFMDFMVGQLFVNVCCCLCWRGALHGHPFSFQCNLKCGCG